MHGLNVCCQSLCVSPASVLLAKRVAKFEFKFVSYRISVNGRRSFETPFYTENLCANFGGPFDGR